jgi:hypothetical protein
LASFLHRSWSSPTPAQIPSPSELEQITPLLYDSGAAGLGWWRIRDTHLGQTESGEMLHQAFRLLVLQASMHEARIRKVFHFLRTAQIEPILIKGWAIARLYPQPGLRPYGDIDLIVRPADYASAKDIAGRDTPDCLVDLHPGPFELKDRPLDQLFERSQLVACGDGNVRVLAAEDHLALLAVHFLKHGGWRPLWLCDIGVLLESSPDGFAWNICLGNDKHRANWILSTVGLAQEILGAVTRDELVATRAQEVSPWLVNCVLRQWQTPFASAQAPQRHQAPISSYLRSPRGLLGDVARRWPNPIAATISVNGIFSPRRRVRYEFMNWLLRAYRILIDTAKWRASVAEHH